MTAMTAQCDDTDKGKLKTWKGKMEEWGTNFRENESEHWGKIFLIATFKKYQFFKNILRLDFFYIMSKEHFVYHEKNCIDPHIY